MLAKRALGVITLLLFAMMTWLGHKAPPEEDSGLLLSAQFSSVDGLKVGAPVRMFGRTIGEVAEIGFIEGTLLPQVTFKIRKRVSLPSDSLVILRSETLLGDKYAMVKPGSMPDALRSGDGFFITDAGVNIEVILDQLLTVVEKAREKSKENVQ